MTSSRGRLRIAVLFGGRSAEHDVSVMSATNVMGALEPSKYEAVPIFVTREGEWLLSRFENGVLARPASGTEIALMPGGRGRMIAIDGGKMSDGGKIDILFPVLHGIFGEDGSVQGLAEVARVPLVGCGILGSATALDKDIAKQLLRAAGLPVARAVTVHADRAPSFDALERALGIPLFIKPARQGSSVGVRKVSSSQEFAPVLAEAFKHDRKLLAEEFIRGREIECSVLEDTKGGLFVSRPGEIIPADSHGFYSYDAKIYRRGWRGAEGSGRASARGRDEDPRDGSARLPGARLRRYGARGFLPDRGHGFFGQRGEHHSRIHRYQHVCEGDGGKRRQLS